MNAVKIVGIVLLVAGILGLVYGSFSYTKETHEAKIGPLELQVKEKETVNVPVWAGVGAIVIGAVLFLPFLIIDLVVASVTLSVGMVQLLPVMFSASFKILLFVLVDGWNLVVGSLVRSFN